MTIALLTLLIRPAEITLGRPANHPWLPRLRHRAEPVLMAGPNFDPATFDHYAQVFEQAPLPMAVLGLAAAEPGVFIELNRALVAMTGHTRRELHQLDLVAITHPADQQAVRLALRRWAAGEWDSAPIEWRWCRPDGGLRWVLLSVARLQDDHQPASCIVEVLDITDRKLLQDRLTRQALHDALTGLPNRLLLDDHLVQALARAKRNRTKVAVLYLDLDDFKQINDSYGHPVGDRVLVEVAGRLRASLRDSDTACRIGGDEFVVVCEDISAGDTGVEMAQRLRQVLAEPMRVAGSIVRLRASVGVALGGGLETPDGLIRLADRAMYAAKPRSRYGATRATATAATPPARPR